MAKNVPLASFKRRLDPEAARAFVNETDPIATDPSVPAVGLLLVHPESSNGEELKSTSADEERSVLPKKFHRAEGRKTIQRVDGRTLRKRTVYLDAQLSQRIAITCAKNQMDFSQAVEDALHFWLTSNE